MCCPQALRVSMEEQRQRQEEEARRAAAASAAEAGIVTPTGDDTDEALLKMSISQTESTGKGVPDINSMTEEEQIAYAMQMSLQAPGNRFSLSTPPSGTQSHSPSASPPPSLASFKIPFFDQPRLWSPSPSPSSTPS
uniref:Uncharacterized protein n=1 Tax=Callorhinchus milii TaxID=7868 RepID=A0A4W3GE95_CALMI